MNEPLNTPMRDVPMLDIDRERMREEFDNFDSMTFAEFKAASVKRVDEILDFVNELRQPGPEVQRLRELRADACGIEFEDWRGTDTGTCLRPKGHPGCHGGMGLHS